MSQKRILVTGAGGFIGAVLVRRLIREGHKVHVLLKPKTLPWRLASLSPALSVHEGDLRQEERIRSLLAAVRPQIVYHLATNGAYPFQTDADGIIQTNIFGTWNLLRAVAHVGTCEVFVNTGSSSEYGLKQFAMRETDLLEPNSYYAVAKSGQTLLCRHFAKVEKLPIVTLRLFSVYGPYEEPSRFIPTIIRNCLRGEDLALVSPDIARDFVFVDDVIDAYLRWDSLSKLYGEIINIGTGMQSTIREVVDLVLAHTRTSVTASYGAMESRVWDSTTWVADCSKSRQLLGWQAATSLSDGLRNTIAWVREEFARNAPQAEHE